MADNTQKYEVLLVTRGGSGCTAASAPDLFTTKAVPGVLRRAVDERRAAEGSQAAPYHLYWQRITLDGTPYLVGGAKVNGGGPTGYMLKSLDTERQDLNSLAWSLGIATALALVGSALLAQAAAATVLRPVQRLGEAANLAGRGASRHPAPGLRLGRAGQSVAHLQPGRGAAPEAGGGAERAGGVQSALRRGHVA
nr:hypothetical protein [Streptomyces himastatinicus]